MKRWQQNPRSLNQWMMLYILVSWLQNFSGRPYPFDIVMCLVSAVPLTQKTRKFSVPDLHYKEKCNVNISLVCTCHTLCIAVTASCYRHFLYFQMHVQQEWKVKHSHCAEEQASDWLWRILWITSIHLNSGSCLMLWTSHPHLCMPLECPPWWRILPDFLVITIQSYFHSFIQIFPLFHSGC